MKTKILALAVATTLLSCKQNVEQRSCYSYFNNKDTVTVSISVKENRVTGEVAYQIYEKDRNVGHITGTLSGDTINAVYEFQSEGVTSSRDAAFLRKENTLLDLTTGFELKQADCRK